MRILPSHEADRTPTPESVPKPAAAPADQDPERMDTLEKMTASILQKLNDMDERVTALEKKPAAPAPQPEEPAAPSAPVMLNTDAIKKGLMTKMWTYLNDKAA